MKFISENLYHVYNRGNNKQKIFFNDKNYIFFLKKIRSHLLKHCKIFAYCLMPNHFHLLLYTNYNLNDGELNSSFAVLLRSYTRAIQLQEKRCGSLFQQKTKAKCLNEIQDEKYNYKTNLLGDYGKICFNYIHQNPLKAHLVKKIEDWQYSSFIDYLGNRKGTLCDQRLACEILDLPVKEKFYRFSYETLEDDKLLKIF